MPDRLFGYPILGPNTMLPGIRRSGVRNASVALGANALREKPMRLALESAFTLIQAIGRHSAISPRARVGEGAFVLYGAVLNADCQIGPGAIIKTDAAYDHDCMIGVCAHIAPRAYLAGNVRVGAGTLVGVGASVSPEAAIGEWAIIGAGSVVTRDAADGLTVFGSPAWPRFRAEARSR